MSKSAPAIPLFGDAYLADTQHLSLEEHGAYLKLMMVAWRLDGCCLADDDTRIARILGVSAAKWAKLKPVIMAFWTLTEDGWIQGRLSKERKFVEEKRAKNSSSANARWEAKSVENIKDDECERISERNAPPPTPPQEEVSKSDASASLRPREPVSDAIEAFNEVARLAGWPRVAKSTGNRQASMRNRLREEGIDGWRAALNRARASPFLGADPPPTFMTFDWIVKPANFAKLVEGNYDHARQSVARQINPNSTVAAILRAEAETEFEDRDDYPETRLALPAQFSGRA
jgi:uncharacterized protein YdaU (DUF1376 family)